MDPYYLALCTVPFIEMKLFFFTHILGTDDAVQQIKSCGNTDESRKLHHRHKGGMEEGGLIQGEAYTWFHPLFL